jgi:hypothetical protein
LNQETFVIGKGNQFHKLKNPVMDKSLMEGSEPHFRNTAKLPQLLRAGVEQFKAENQQALFLYSVLTVCSGLLTKVKGVYDQKTIYPNLFLLVVAPPASGKSTMMFSETVLSEIHEKVYSDSIKVKADHEKKVKAAKQTGEDIEQSKPPFNVVLIPANTSGSKIISHLADNDKSNTPSVIIESEIDTLVNALRNDWGNFSDTLRKGFHNESVRQSRKIEDSYIEVKTPKLAVALSGTMNQVKKLIPTTEDGLYSRFLVYLLKGDQQWRDVSPCHRCINLNDFFIDQAKEYLAFWEYISPRSISLTFTKEQWDKINEVFGNFHKEETEYEESDRVGLVVRHGVMLYKLCMVLTAFRIYEEKNELDRVVCKQEDFETAMNLIARSLAASIELFTQLPLGGRKIHDRKDEFFKKLPDEFETKGAIRILATGDGAPKKRTIELWLEKWVQEGQLIKPEIGKYKKIADCGSAE